MLFQLSLNIFLKALFSWKLAANILQTFAARLKSLLDCPDYFTCTILGQHIWRGWVDTRKVPSLPCKRRLSPSRKLYSYSVCMCVCANSWLASPTQQPTAWATSGCLCELGHTLDFEWKEVCQQAQSLWLEVEECVCVCVCVCVGHSTTNGYLALFLWLPWWLRW